MRSFFNAEFDHVQETFAQARWMRRAGASSGLGGGRLCRALLLTFVLAVSQGCYAYVPVVDKPAPGTTLALNLSDRGRAEMGELIGPSAAAVEGRLQSEDDSVYVLNVTSVRYLRGQSHRWSGEPVTLRKGFVAGVRVRQFSRTRTILAAGATVGGIVAFALSRGLFGLGGDADDGGVEPCCEQ